MNKYQKEIFSASSVVTNIMFDRLNERHGICGYYDYSINGLFRKSKIKVKELVKNNKIKEISELRGSLMDNLTYPLCESIINEYVKLLKL